MSELCDYCYEYHIDPERKYEQEEGKMCPLCDEYTIPIRGEGDE